MISVEKIKELRDRTGVSMAVCKNALEKAEGDMDRALDILKEEGVKVAEKKAQREMFAGLIDSYIHSDRKIGVLLDVRTETDFVARNSDFKSFVHDLAMHIAASSPKDVEELLSQIYIKNPEMTINDYLKQTIQKFGENIKIERFVIYSLR